MQVLDDQSVVNSVKGFGQINEGKNHSMGFGSVKEGVDEVEEANEIVSDRGTFESTTVCRIKIWLNNGHEPVT